MKVTRDERIALAALYASGGRIPPVALPVDAAVMVDLAERGLVHQTPEGMWWLTEQGQTVVESWL